MLHGICNLSIVPVRTEPTDKGELCTQLLFGDGYFVLEITANNKWMRIRILQDNYEGWIDVLQHNGVNIQHFESFLMCKHGICQDDLATIDLQHETKYVHLGCTLPFLSGRICTIGNESYNFQGELYKPNLEVNFAIIQFFCLRFLNAPYLWGGKTLFGIDCSGYVQQVYKLLGYQLDRDAYQQARQGKDINFEIHNVGDLAFFENDKGKVIHVGILLDKNKIIHAHGKVRIDVLIKWYFKHRFKKAFA